MLLCFFFSSRRRHTRYWRDWSSDVCSSDLDRVGQLDLLAPGDRALEPVGGVDERDVLARAAVDPQVGGGEQLVVEGVDGGRSEKRRVGKEGRSRGAPVH